MKKKLLISTLTVTLLSCSCFPVYASHDASMKEEVVYVMIDGNGNAKNTYVVNIFNDQNIVDYGNYQAVKVLNTTDTIEKNGDRMHIQTNADQLYYQGTLENGICPWDISIGYFVDGQKLTAKQIAGQNGQVEIQFDITKNKAYTGDYFERFALQISFSLDSEKCTNIKANGATIANVGRQKQLSYLALPGKGLHASVIMDAKDFAMSAVSINGIDLNLDVDINENQLKSKLDELIKATTLINDGTQQLKSGNSSLCSGYQVLPQGAKELNEGLTALDQGISSLQNGMSQLQNGLEMLDRQSSSLSANSKKMKDSLELIQKALSSFQFEQQQLEKLQTSSHQFRQGISSLYDGMISLQQNVSYHQYKTQMKANGLDIDGLINDNHATIKNIENQIIQLEDMILQEPQDSKRKALLNEQIAQLKHVITLLNTNNQAISGMESYLDRVNEKLTMMKDQMNTVNSQYTVFDDSIDSMTASFQTMMTNLKTLSVAINEIVSQYGTLDNGIQQYTGAVTSLVKGYQQLMHGTYQLSAGSQQLRSGSERLYDGTQKVYDNLTLLSHGSDKLAAATHKLHDQSVIMKEQLNLQIDELLSGISHKDSHYDSFVSAKNTQVKSVQFVIQSDAIEKTEKVKKVKTKEEKSQSFLDRLLALFGIS